MAVKRNRLFLLAAGVTLWMIFHLYWIVPAVFASPDTLRQDRTVIRVQPNSVVTGDRVLLKDIAEIQASPFLKQSIENIDIGPSPQPNRIEVLEERKIAYQLRSLDYLPDDFQLICPDRVYVKRKGQQVSKEQIQAYLISRFDTVFASRTVEIKHLSFRGLEACPQGRVTFSADLDKLVSARGRIAGYLDIFVDSVLVDRINVTGELAVYDGVVFARQPIDKGQVLEPGDFYTKRVNIYKFNHPIVHRVSVVEGKMLQTGMKKDDCLKADNLTEPPLVRKGDIITLVAVHHHLKIVTTGMSKQDGFKNELIRVENLQSGKLVRGIVKENSIVEVVY
jgi:flagella basal body P-ring formation protein FlgA